MINKPSRRLGRGSIASGRAVGNSQGRPSHNPRAPGRPRASESPAAREALIESARELFARYGYRAVSSRQIAAAAGVNVALIRYYFGGKPGLYRQVLQDVLVPLRTQLDAMLSQRAEVDLGGLQAEIMTLYAANPWIAGIIVREVLTPDGPLRPLFMREAPDKLYPLVEAIVRREMAQGRLRHDLDPKLTVLSLISLTVFPFLAFPLTSHLFGVRLEPEFAQRLARHSADVLMRGIAAPRDGYNGARGT